jgi:hypothetical protein
MSESKIIKHYLLKALSGNINIDGDVNAEINAFCDEHDNMAIALRHLSDKVEKLEQKLNVLSKLNVIHGHNITITIEDIYEELPQLKESLAYIHGEDGTYNSEILRAFNVATITARISGIMDIYVFRKAHIYYAVSELCKELVNDKDGIWWQLWKEYEKLAERTIEENIE